MSSLRDRLQATKQVWEEARQAAIDVLNESYDERHGPCADEDGYNYFKDDMVGIQIEEGSCEQPPGYCDKIFLKLSGGPDLRDIGVQYDLNDDVCEKLREIGFDEVTVEQVDGVDLEFFDTHRPASNNKIEGNS